MTNKELPGMTRNNRKLLYIILAAILAAGIMYVITANPNRNALLDQPDGKIPHIQPQDK